MTDLCPGPPASMVQASALVSPLCPNISTPLLCPPGEAEISHKPVVRGRQAAMLLSPPAWQGAGWILCTLHEASLLVASLFIEHVLCAKQYHLTPSTVPASTHQQPHPWKKHRRLHPPLSKIQGNGRVCASTVRPASSSSTSAVGDHKGACLSWASSVYVFPFGAGVGGAKKPNRSQEALRERGAYDKSRQTQQERACRARRCPLTPRPCPQGGGDAVPLSPVFSHLLSSVISKLAIVE